MHKTMAFIGAMFLAASAHAQDCALKQIASLPITTTASGKIAVPAKIAGTARWRAWMPQPSNRQIAILSRQELPILPENLGEYSRCVY